MAEGAPLLREYAGKTCIVGSNPTVSANEAFALRNRRVPSESPALRGFLIRGCGLLGLLVPAS